MKCEECQPFIEAYFDRELDLPLAGAVADHVKSCSRCNTSLEQLTLEHRVYQRYDRELEVSPALWSRLREQLDEEDVSQPLFEPEPGERSAWIVGRLQTELSRLLGLRFSMVAAVALVLFAVVFTVAVMKYLNMQDTSKQLAVSSETLSAPPNLTAGTRVIPEPVKSVGTESHGASAETKKSKPAGPGVGSALRRVPGVRREDFDPATPERLVREAEQKYLSAIAMLSRDVEQRPARLDSGTRIKLDGALAAIDRTILSTRRAVQRNPSDPLAVQYMLAAYGKKVEVLKEMSNY